MDYQNPFLRGWANSERAQQHGQLAQLQKMQAVLGMQAQQEAAVMNPLKRQLLEEQVRQAQNPSLTRVDFGDRIGFIDGSGNIVRSIPKGATPDAVLREGGADRRHEQPSGNTVYSGNIALRGQNMTDARTRAEGAANRGVTLAGINRPQFSEAAGGWVIPPVLGSQPPAPPQDYSPGVSNAFGITPQRSPQGGMQIPPHVQAQRDADASRIRTAEANGGAGMIPTSSVIPVPGLTPGRGRPPPGYRLTPGGDLEAIPGGPADTKAGETAERNRRREDGALSRADLVISKVEKALDQTGFFTTGLTGANLGWIPGTSAFNYQKTLDTIIGNIGFQELQAMREASPTGGALGQVAVKELEMLQSVLSSLDKGQSEGQQRENLMLVGKHFQNWKNAVRESRGLPPEPNRFVSQAPPIPGARLRFDANGNPAR